LNGGCVRAAEGRQHAQWPPYSERLWRAWEADASRRRCRRGWEREVLRRNKMMNGSEAYHFKNKK
jgi:hypothetical protein